MPIIPETFEFAVINDLHYTDSADRLWLNTLIDRINDSKVDLCLVLGDLAETGSEEELAAAKEILDRLTMPYAVVPGNHDGPPDRPADLPDGVGLETYDALFPNRRNYTFTHKNWQFIALDTSNGSAWSDVPLRPQTLAFARLQSAVLDPLLPCIVFTHFPINPEVRFTLANGPDLVAALKPLNLRIVFSGHYHGYSEASIHEVPCLTNRCCSMRREVHDNSNLRGYFLCTAQGDTQAVSYTFVELPSPLLFQL